MVPVAIPNDDTMKRVHFFAIKHLLALTGFCGVINLIYLLLYAGLDSNEDRYPSRLLGRQISSIDEDNKYQTTTNYGHLEMMNFDFKEILDRYSLSMNTLGKNYEQARHTRKGVNKLVYTRKKAINIVKMSRCQSPPFLLIQVHSSPGNFLSREAIRLSWGRPENAINQGSWSKPKRSWKTVFLVGKSNNSRINDLLQQEAQFYDDIIIGDFSDTFRHLSHKMLLGIKWSLTYCRPKYILKTDEDCYINVISLLLWLSNHHNVNSSKDLYRGKVQRNMQVERDEDSRYFVSERNFKGMFYKPYTSGGGYLFGGNLLARLYKATNSVPLIPIEDAYFGMLMDRIGVKPEMDLRFLPFVNCERSYETLFERPMCHFKDPFVIHGVNEVQQIHMHYNVLIMNFMPTVCSYVESQSGQNYLKRIC